jgi:hypothetical protein
MVESAEVRWVLDNDPITNPDDFPWGVRVTRTPFVISFGEQHRGKSVRFRLRWINTRQKGGPWSGEIRAIIS